MLFKFRNWLTVLGNFYLELEETLLCVVFLACKYSTQTHLCGGTQADSAFHTYRDLRVSVCAFVPIWKCIVHNAYVDVTPKSIPHWQYTRHIGGKRTATQHPTSRTFLFSLSLTFFLSFYTHTLKLRRLSSAMHCLCLLLTTNDFHSIFVCLYILNFCVHDSKCHHDSKILYNSIYTRRMSEILFEIRHTKQIGIRCMRSYVFDKFTHL